MKAIVVWSDVVNVSLLAALGMDFRLGRCSRTWPCSGWIVGLPARRALRSILQCQVGRGHHVAAVVSNANPRQPYFALLDSFFALGSWHRRHALVGDKAMKLDVIQP